MGGLGFRDFYVQTSYSIFSPKAASMCPYSFFFIKMIRMKAALNSVLPVTSVDINRAASFSYN